MPTDRPDLREVASDDDMDGRDGTDDGSGSVASRIKRARERLQKRRSRKRTEAKAEKLKRQRNIAANKPKTASESVAAAGKEIKLLASELGVSPERAGSILDDASNAVDEFGGDLDFDGDGDTDVLRAIEAEIDGRTLESDRTDRSRRRSRGGIKEPPIGGVEDDLEPLSGVEEELGLDTPIEEQQGGLF